MRAKLIPPYRLEILEAKICGADRMVKFLSPGFPDNFAQKIIAMT
jgi:hypothetical protein